MTAIAEPRPVVRWHRVSAVVRRHVLVQVRNPGHRFLLLILPVVDALLFSSIGVAFGQDDRAVEILVVGILLFHVIWQLTLSGSLGFLEEVWSRNVLNLWTTPLTESEYGLALLVTGLVLQFGETAEVFSWGLLVLLMPLSGIFYPPEALPGVLQPVAQVIPLTRIFEATRESLLHGTVQWVDLGLGAAGSLVCVGLGAWFVRRQLRRFREQGWITRFS